MTRPAASRTGTPWWRAGAVVLLALLASVLLAAPAVAHPAVVASSPGDGAELPAAPDEVSITFGEGVEAPLGSIKVYDGDSERVDQDDARLVGTDRRTAVVSLAPDLPDGTYVVIWRAIGLGDGHLVLGQQHFVVGDHTADGAAGAAADRTGTGLTTTATRAVGAVGTLATVVAAGVAFFAVVLLRQPGERWRQARLTLTRVVHTAAAVACVAALLTILGHAAERAAAFDDPLSAATVAATVVGPVGTAALARALLLLPLATRHLLGVRGYVLATTTTAAATLAVDGHVTGIAVLAAVVHVLVVAAWSGGLVGLLLAVRSAPDRDADGLAAATARFSGFAAVTVVIAGAAGALVAVATAGFEPAAAAESPWGRALILKTLVAVAALLVAAHTRTVVMPRLRREVAAVPQGGAVDVALTSPVSAARPATLALLRRNLVVETALVAGVLVTSGTLGTLPPPTAASAADDDCPTPPSASVAGIAHDCEEGSTGPT